MKSVIAVLAVMVGIGSVSGADLELYGYFEPEFSGATVNDQFLQLNSNKLRVDLSSSLSDQISFTGNVNILNYNGRTEWSLLEFVPERLSEPHRQLAPEAFAYRYEDDAELDNAYVRMYGRGFTITFGRQQIASGSGYVWNPTDPFNDPVVLDPTYEVPGVNGVRLDADFVTNMTLTLFYSPEESWERSRKLLRWTARLPRFDLSLSAAQRPLTISDFSTLESMETRQDMFGVDINADLFGVGCWSENAYNKIDNGADYWSNVLGVDYTFESGWYWVAEYYHDESGKKSSCAYTFTDWIRYLTGETRTVSQDQVYTYTSYPFTDLLSGGGTVVYSISDGSVLLIPTLEYSVSDDLTLTFFGNAFTGKEGTMYSTDMGSGGLIRLRAYF